MCGLGIGLGDDAGEIVLLSGKGVHLRAVLAHAGHQRGALGLLGRPGLVERGQPLIGLLPTTLGLLQGGGHLFALAVQAGLGAAELVDQIGLVAVDRLEQGLAPTGVGEGSFVDGSQLRGAEPGVALDRPLASVGAQALDLGLARGQLVLEALGLGLGIGHGPLRIGRPGLLSGDVRLQGRDSGFQLVVGRLQAVELGRGLGSLGTHLLAPGSLVDLVRRSPSGPAVERDGHEREQRHQQDRAPADGAGGTVGTSCRPSHGRSRVVIRMQHGQRGRNVAAVARQRTRDGRPAHVATVSR